MQVDLVQEAADWFERAVQSYIDLHQGCPWCGSTHCVFRSRRLDHENYSCSECDFSVCHLYDEDQYLVRPGEQAAVQM